MQGVFFMKNCVSLFLLGLSLLILPLNLQAAGEYTTDLIAGQTTDAGDVTVWTHLDYLYVKYETTGDWKITDIHLSIQTDPGDFPATGGGKPKIGKFEYKRTYNPAVTEDTFQIALVDIGAVSGEEVYVAAHAVVQEKIYQPEDISFALPAGQVCVTPNYPGGDSYFNTDVTGWGSLDGTYDGWCVDSHHNIGSGNKYYSKLYSPFDPIVATLVDPVNGHFSVLDQNINKLNYIINNVDNYLALGYSWASIHSAIWFFSDDINYEWGGSDPAHIQAIKDDVIANGCNFVPTCDQLVAIIVKPEAGVPDNAQVNIIVVSIDSLEVCQCNDETAWGQGTDFPGSSWAMYFPYSIP